MASRTRIGTVALAGALAVAGTGAIVAQGDAPASVEARLCVLEGLHGIEDPSCTSSPTTTDAPGSTTSSTTTTTTSAPPVTTTTVAPPAGVVWSEDFASPDSMQRFDSVIFYRDSHAGDSSAPWPGDHSSTGPDDACGPPSEKRTISRGGSDAPDGPVGPFDDGWIYRCEPGGDTAKAHLMTSIGPAGSGYSIGAFWPTDTFSAVTEVRWDQNMSLLRVGDRQWTEIAVVPVVTFDPDRLPCQQTAPCGNDNDGSSQVSYADLGAVGAHWGRFMGISNTAGFEDYDGNTLGVWRFVNDPALSSIVIRRTHFFRDNGDGTLTYGQEQEDGSFYEFSIPGEFPAGEVRVLFKDHNYTPIKGMDDLGIPAEDQTFTWHWDDIEIIGADR